MGHVGRGGLRSLLSGQEGKAGVQGECKLSGHAGAPGGRRGPAQSPGRDPGTGDGGRGTEARGTGCQGLLGSGAGTADAGGPAQRAVNSGGPEHCTSLRPLDTLEFPQNESDHKREARSRPQRHSLERGNQDRAKTRQQVPSGQRGRGEDRLARAAPGTRITCRHLPLCPAAGNGIWETGGTAGGRESSLRSWVRLNAPVTTAEGEQQGSGADGEAGVTQGGPCGWSWTTRTRPRTPSGTRVGLGPAQAPLTTPQAPRMVRVAPSARSRHHINGNLLMPAACQASAAAWGGRCRHHAPACPHKPPSAPAHGAKCPSRGQACLPTSDCPQGAARLVRPGPSWQARRPSAAAAPAPRQSSQRADLRPQKVTS